MAATAEYQEEEIQEGMDDDIMGPTPVQKLEVFLPR